MPALPAGLLNILIIILLLTPFIMTRVFAEDGARSVWIVHCPEDTGSSADCSAPELEAALGLLGFDVRLLNDQLCPESAEERTALLLPKATAPHCVFLPVTSRHYGALNMMWILFMS